MTLVQDRAQTSPTSTATVRRRRRGLRRALVVILVCCCLLTVGVLGLARYVAHELTGQIRWMPNAFSGLSDRPTKPTEGAAAKALNILLVGSDRRSAEQTTGSVATARQWVQGAQRSDTLMLLHVSGDRRTMGVISIPRDSWVAVPGYGHRKINAALSYAGPSLAVATVERLTNVRVDHIAVVDWEGFRKLVDIVGGIEVEVPKTVHDSARDHTWVAGRHRLSGDEALLYARQRYGLPGGDLDRVRRQQNVLRALLLEVRNQGGLASKVRMYRLLDAVTENLSVDTAWTTDDMRQLASDVAGVSQENIGFATAPIRGTGRVGDQSVVFLDERANRELWTAVRRDRLAEWFTNHPAADLGTRVR